MKLTRFFVTIFSLIIFCLISIGQGSLSSSDLRNVDVSKLSDGEIRGYFQKAQDSGLSEDQLLELATSRGLSNDQAAKLRERFGLLGLTGKNPANVNTAVSSDLGAERQYDNKENEIPMTQISFNPRIFGSELFTGTSTTFEPNLRIATPSNYILGPDDELIINVFGYSEKTYRQKINAEGNIFIENVGPILVSGLSIEEAEAKIRSKLGSTIYRAMSSGATKMQLRLGSIRSMRITIIGEAKKPGTFTVSSLTTLFNALYICGGPSDLGSYRNIELIRGNKVIRKVDLYKFLTAGDRSDNLLLQEQDIIRIPFYEGRITFSGYIKRPGIYELATGESLEKIFSYAGKFTDNAYRKSVTIYQISDEKLAIKTLPSDDFAVYVPNNADSIVIGTATMRFTNRISIRGAVLRPGDYELMPGMELKDLIEKAGGLREDAFQDGGNILRIGDDLGPENVSFVTKKIVKGEESIVLKRDDEIIVNSIFDIRDKYVVNIEGEVTKPGQFEWRRDLRVRDLILLAGGITEAGLSGNEIHIEVSRRIKKSSSSVSDIQQSEIIRINTTKNLADSQALLVLEPFDIIVVRPQPGYQPQKSVYINGPVIYPGRYFLEKSNERITDVLIRAGQFKSSADSSSVFIRRFKKDDMEPEERAALLARISNIPVDSIFSSPSLSKEIQKNYTSLSVNLQKAFQNRGGNDDIVLEAGDIILVSQNSSLVRVSGEVYYPTLLPYEKGTNIKYYIKRTGDYTKAARQNQTFVIYPDGKAEGVKKFLFFKSYPKVTPRSEIFVPSKGEKSKQGLSTGEWVALSSVLATLTTLVVSVINAN